MGRKVKFMTGEVPCWYDPIGNVIEAFYKVRKNPYLCVCCKKPILLGEPIALLLNNCFLFPNKTIHQDCFKGQETIDFLVIEYREYQAALQKYKHWD